MMNVLSITSELCSPDMVVFIIIFCWLSELREFWMWLPGNKTSVKIRFWNISEWLDMCEKCFVLQGKSLWSSQQEFSQKNHHFVEFQHISTTLERKCYSKWRPQVLKILSMSKNTSLTFRKDIQSYFHYISIEILTSIPVFIFPL